MRAEEHGVDATACVRERAMHLVVNRVQRREIEQPSTHTGLVRRDDDAIAGMVEPRDRLEAARYRTPLVDVLDVGVAVEIDDAVAVEDDNFRGGSIDGHQITES